MEEQKPKCFIIMPISTPEKFLERYNSDKSHFRHVFEYLFVPTIEKLGYLPIDPASQGSELIHANIIQNLQESDLILCDMSTLNANVFFELGIRTALNKPVALVRDKFTTTLPFDTNLINNHTYSPSLNLWEIESERDKLFNHLLATTEKSANHNSLWKYFGLTVTGNFTELEDNVDDKLSLILRHLEDRDISNENDSNKPTDSIYEFAEKVLRKDRAIIQDFAIQGNEITIDCGGYIINPNSVTEIKNFARYFNYKVKVLSQNT